MAVLSGSTLSSRTTILTAVTIGTVAALAGRHLYKLLTTTKRSGILIYKAPRGISASSDPEPYPSDALPGWRDVDTPWGSIRVNEWGPLDGRRVLFIHGVSTPSISCAHMALQLAREEGCRVMMFDLFGRGYSDSPDPSDCKQDIRLFTSQVLLVLASSPICWAGGNRFTLVGYSLGGGIAASFASYFPHMIESLVLIAPAGLMRASRIQLSSRLIYGGFLPELLRDHIVRQRISGPPVKKSKALQDSPPGSPAPIDVEDDPGTAPSSTAPLLPDTTASAAETVAWQLQENPGFLPAFISSIAYAPISGEHDRWRLIGSRLSAQKRNPQDEAAQRLGLKEGKVLIMFGDSDGVVVPQETIEDAIGVLGKDNVQIEVMEGGHDVVITNSHGCVKAMREFWDTAA